MMDTNTLILLSVGVITLATMVFCIMNTEDEVPRSKKSQKDEPEETFDDETEVYTVDDDEDESIFDSE